MKSKEALRRLYSCSMLKYDTAKQYAEVIEKDLEVLEIIKKYKNINLNFTLISVCKNHKDYKETYEELYWGSDDIDLCTLTEEEFQKLKEWLLNDK